MGVAHAGQILAPAGRDPRGGRERLFCCIRQPAHQALPNSSGSLAIFAAIRRASSRVSSLAAEGRPLNAINVRESLSVVAPKRRTPPPSKIIYDLFAMSPCFKIFP